MLARRFALTIMLAFVMAFGAVSLSGCGGDEQDSQSQQASASQAADSSAAEDNSASSDDDEQDNCYGDDLPAVKK